MLIQAGLYAPSAGIHYRDEQRRRRSQFDRGTTMAESEGRMMLEYRMSAGEVRLGGDFGAIIHPGGGFDAVGDKSSFGPNASPYH